MTEQSYRNFYHAAHVGVSSRGSFMYPLVVGEPEVIPAGAPAFDLSPCQRRFLLASILMDPFRVIRVGNHYQILNLSPMHEWRDGVWQHPRDPSGIVIIDDPTDEEVAMVLAANMGRA